MVPAALACLTSAFLQTGRGEASPLCQSYGIVTELPLEAGAGGRIYIPVAGMARGWDRFTGRHAMPPTQPHSSARPSSRASVAAALGRGGVGHDVTRPELWAMLRGVADAMEVCHGEGFCEDDRAARSLSPESVLDDALVRGGVAVLCPDRPIVLPGIEPTLRLTYLAEPIDVGAGGRRIDTLFLILGPSAAVHEDLLAELANLLDTPAFVTLLAGRASVERLLDAFGALGESVPVASRY